ncbi:DUF2516 family protein [Brevibacterium sp. 5221]|uniref:DUF2516 family protein n=1 Tax=Brevibacterium rongguiense TaxID=2695267 RepID=A0A6N9H6J9_9MICO|nr:MULTISPECIES: DUF2516 family protein [Brevibacterium]MYM19501.1 DUF2516 family protein [Brevibacterium rongguiense]WAL39994.1 DUF2516 family protein [Brevibacterium sp. BRM-1]
MGTGLGIIGTAQSYLFIAITVGVFLLELVALIDALRYSGEAYRAAGKLTKGGWCGILGGAAVVGFLAMPPLSIMPMFVSILGFVAAAVYFLDVRKAVRSIDPKFRGR